MSPLRRLRVLALAAAAAAGCGERGGTTFRIFGLDPATNAYGEFDATFGTLEDAREMRGATVRFVGGATIKGDLLVASADPKSADILNARGGGAPDCRFADRGGVLHADDYDSLNMASAYWALERSRDLFIDLGVAPADLDPLPAYYHPRIEMLTKVVPTYFLFMDNAAYAPGFDGFMILPHVSLDSVPLSMNLGVMAHEYAHKIFTVLFERGARVPAFTTHDWTTAAANQRRGVDEGVADIYGHLITGDPDFIRKSLSGSGQDPDRDLSTVRKDSDELVKEWLEAEGLEFRQHHLGAHLAGTLWRFGETIDDHRRVAVAVLDVQREIAEEIATTPKYDFSVLGFLDKIAARFTGPERQALCDEVKARFPRLIFTDKAHAPGSCP